MGLTKFKDEKEYIENEFPNYDEVRIDETDKQD